MRRIGLGLITDDSPERLVATRTAVVVGDGHRFSPRTRDFIDRLYVQAGPVRVLGCVLRSASDSTAGERRFVIVVPGRFAVVAGSGRAQGHLDGTVYRGPRWLAAGAHVYQPGEERGGIEAIWASAAPGATPPGAAP